MIYVDEKRCNSCGACLEVCPVGAISQTENVVMIDETVCDACEACLAACPTGAIVLVEPVSTTPVMERQPVTALREPAVTSIRQPDPPPSLRDLALPALGTVLVWTGRTIVPKLVALAQNLIERRSITATPSSIGNFDRRQTGRSVTRIYGKRSGRRGRRRHNRGRGRR